MGIMIFMLKSQRRAFRWLNNLRARLYILNSGSVVTDIIHFNPVTNDLSDLQLPLLALLITWREKLMRIFTFEVFIF